MPTSLGQLTFAFVALGVLLGACTYLIHRYGDDADVDLLVVLWRRWGALGRVPVAREPVGRRRPPIAKPVVATPRTSRPPRATKPKPVAKRPPATRARSSRMKAAGSPREDVPLTDEEPTAGERAEPKLALRQRFRQGLRKTRQKFTRDMREVFGGGATDEAFDALEEALVAADVGVATATALTDDLRRRRAELAEGVVPPTLKEAMVARLSGVDRRLRLSRDRTSIWVVCGVNGTGKTTSIAKLAARSKSLGIKTCLAAADTFRAAAVEQLEEWGRRVDVPVIRQDQGADPGAVVFDAIAHAKAQHLNLVIVDTAGRLHTRKPLMDELKKVLRVIERTDDAVLTECLLVIDATTGQNGITQAQAFKDAAGVTGLVLAKLDGTAKGGVVFAVEQDLGVPVKAVGTGEHFRDLVPFEPEAFVDALIGED